MALERWDGGQYLEWADAEPMPIPSKKVKQPYSEESWQESGYFFYDNAEAVEMSHDHIRFLLARVNSISGQVYGHDPSIMAWQLAHQPRRLDNRGPYLQWIRDTSSLIKTLAPHHMVTVGQRRGAHVSSAEEHWSPWAVDTAAFEEEHAGKHVDFVTVHLWPAQWGWLCTRHQYSQCQAKASEKVWLDRVRQY